MKGGKYTKTLAKIWVEGIIRIRDIRGNVIPKFIELCMETKPTETSVPEFCDKSVNLLLGELINIRVVLFLILELFR